MRILLGIALVVIAGAGSGESQAPSYYCGNRLVRLGTSIEDMPRLCGEPDVKSQRFGSRCSVDASAFDHGRRCRATLVDEWVYDYGEERLRRRFVFVDARLAEVRTDGFGR